MNVFLRIASGICMVIVVYLVYAVLAALLFTEIARVLSIPMSWTRWPMMILSVTYWMLIIWNWKRIF